MSTQICNPCADGKVCIEGLDNYSLQDDTYYFVLNCPPNVYCGGASTIYLVCCDGTTMQQTIPQGSTVARRNALIADLVSRCARLTTFCAGGDGGDRPPGTNVPNDGTDPNNPVPYYWNNPTGATVRCPDGNPFTFKVPAGVFLARSQAEADAAAVVWARQMAAANKICITAPQRVCCNGVAYSSTVVASGGIGVLDGSGGFGPSVFTWNIIGTLPTGLTTVPFGHNALRISGIPTTNGNYTFTIRAVDTHGAYMDKPTSIRVWGITDTSLPDVIEGDPYSHQLTTTGGTTPYTYTLVSGGFPLGISMSSTGLIDGLAGEAGAFTSIIRVRDASGATCSKEFTLTSLVATDCASIAGESTQTWSESKIITDGYEPCEVLQLVDDPDYYGFTQDFDGTAGRALLVETTSDDGEVHHCVYVKLTVSDVNVGTNTVTFAGTHTWATDVLNTSDFNVLMIRTGINAGQSSGINSNTADAVVVDDASIFTISDEVMLLYYVSLSNPAFRIPSLPVTETYTVETGVYLGVGEEDIEWTYNIACQYYMYEVTSDNATPQIYGFVPYGSTAAGTYQRYMRLDCLASFTGSLTIDAVLVRSGSEDLTDYQAVNYLGATTNYIHELHVTDGVTDIDGNITGWQAPNKPDMVTLGTMWGWYDDISGNTTYPQWAWTEDNPTQITAAPTGAGTGTFVDTETYVWTYSVVGTGTLSVLFNPGDSGDANHVSTTADSLIGSAYINNPVWHAGGGGYWDFAYRGLSLVKTKLYGLIVGRSYKVTSTLTNHATSIVVQTDEQTVVATAGTETLTTMIQMTGNSMTYGDLFDLNPPTILDVTP